MQKEIVNVNGIDMIAHQDMVVKDARDNGWVFEEDSFTKWLEFSQGGWVIDVGAYTGIYSIAAFNVGATVDAFEPNPVVYDRLKDNINLNRASVSAYQIGIGSSRGKFKLKLKPSTPITSAGKIVCEEHPSDDCVDVQVSTLDKLFAGENGFLKAMKIDVEGYELEVLKGAKDLIAKNRPCLIVECLDDTMVNMVVDFLSQFDYPEPTFMDGRNLVFDTRG